MRWPPQLTRGQRSLMRIACENPMKRTLLVLVLAMFGGGCHLFAHVSQSTFLSRFSLERSPKQTAYKGIDSSRGPGGESGH